MKKTTKAKKTVKATKAVKRVTKPAKAKPQVVTNEATPEVMATTYATALVQKGTSITTDDPALKGANQLVAQAALLQVSTQEQAMEAGRMLVQLKTWKGQVEQKRQFFTRPLKEHVKRVEALFKPLIERLDEADAVIRGKVLNYRVESERLAREEQAKLMEQAQAAQASGNDEVALALATQASESNAGQKTMMLDEGSMQVKRVWDFEVEDYAAIPREFFSFDEKKVRLAIRAGQREIPGIRVFQKEQLAVSSSAIEPAQVTLDEALRAEAVNG